MHISVYCQIKDENNILKNWINHYLNLNFDHIYLIDDQSKIPIKNVINNNEYLKNKITVITIDFSSEDFYNCTPTFSNSLLYDEKIYKIYNKSKQIYMLNIFKKMYENQLDWLFICDADEFLYLKNYETISEYLSKYLSINPNIPGIMFQWLMYGNSYNDYFPNGNIFNNFVMSDINLYHLPKCLTKVQSTDAFDIHKCFLKNDLHYYIPHYNTLNIIESKTLPLDKSYCIHHELVDAYLAHYITLDLNNFTFKKFKRKLCSQDMMRDKTFICHLFHNRIVNLKMLKYINNINNDIIKNFCELEVLYLDINKYNLTNKTNFIHIYDMLIHFYDNLTNLFYSPLNKILPDFNSNVYKDIYPDLQHLTNHEAVVHYFVHGIEEHRKYLI